MLSDRVLEMIFSHPEMHKIPIGCQSTAVMVFGDVIERIKENEPYATVESILSADDSI
jgi:hypothetical protein